MITFSSDHFTIKVPTGGNHSEDWLMTCLDLLELLRSESEDLHSNHHYTINLLKDMLPDYETAKKMTQ